MKEFSLSLDRGKKYLLGLSGGADSVCLFHLLRLNGYDFSAAHINHNIRGEEAERDEDFCRELCRNHSIEFFLANLDVPAMAKRAGESLEEAARNARYTFFEQIMRENSIDILLTAHNADDNAETLLMHLVRGTGLKGLGGIAPRRDKLIRPMLSITRSDVEAFLEEYAVPHIEDSSNGTDEFLRNRIRHHVMPLLKQENPSLAESMSAMARR